MFNSTNCSTYASIVQHVQVLFGPARVKCRRLLLQCCAVSMLPIPLTFLLCYDFVTIIHLLSTIAPCALGRGAPQRRAPPAAGPAPAPRACLSSSGSSRRHSPPSTESRARAASKLLLCFLLAWKLAYQICSTSSSFSESGGICLPWRQWSASSRGRVLHALPLVFLRMAP